MSNQAMARRIAVIMMKGGVRKTTTAMLLSLGLAKRGERVLLIDADPYTQGVTDWMTEAYVNGVDGATDEPPIDVVQWAPREGLLVPYVDMHLRRTAADRVIIDVGGEAPEIAAQAIRYADLVLSPCGAERAETGRLDATRGLVRKHGNPAHEVVLTRVPVAGQGAAREAREALVGAGYTVAPEEVPQQRRVYSEVWGTFPSNLGAYDAMAARLHA